MQMRKALLALGMCATALALSSAAQTWRQVGPPDGTVISLAADPNDINRLFLGTAGGHVFASNDEGGHWQLISRIGTGQDDVITHIIVDRRNAKHLYASTWSLYSGGGGVYRSDDAGHTWNIIGLAHETVRALAQSPNNPKLFLAGSLTGVYRSMDDGASWERITPAKHDDLRNFDSVAFDPKDDNIIYAGTYHLPWKTSNGGKDWFPVVKGMIDDSDVMSIIVDPANPENVHATACSGIYHSMNGGTQWVKYQGIPSVFRRTQLIRMDPKNTQKLIIGTEREGVQISTDGGTTFTAANTGFHHQHIADVAMDREHPERALVELTFDTDAFLATQDGGNSWATLGPGLKRTETRHVYATPTGWWASLTTGGWMKYDEAAHKWSRTGLYVPDSGAASAATKGKKGANSKSKAPVARTSAPQ